MKQFKYILPLVSLLWLMASCGEGTVDVQNESYEQRLVIEGYLIANTNFIKVNLTRNFKLDTDLSRMNLLPDPEKTEAYVTCLDDGRIYELSLVVVEHPGWTEAYWGYQGDDLKIGTGKTYKLDVNAEVDGKRLQASSQTTVPMAGFEITKQNYDSLLYRQKDNNGNLRNFELTFDMSPGVHLYVAAVQALNPSLENFIYDNPYEEYKPEDIEIVDFAYEYDVFFNLDEQYGESTIAIQWDEFWFYDDYQIILYGTDQNYREFSASHHDVQEMDGNFHEAVFNIDGDGIGVFGSIIADTVYCKVLEK